MSREITLQPFRWYCTDFLEQGATLRAWAHLPADEKDLDKPSEKVLLLVEGFEPFIRIELPTMANNQPARWTRESITIYTRWLRTQLGDNAPTVIKYQLQRKLYHYRAIIGKDGKSEIKKNPFLTAYFNNFDAMRKAINFLAKTKNVPNLGLIRAVVCEHSVDQVVKFLALTKRKYCQWLRCQVFPVKNRASREGMCQEYRTTISDLKEVPPEEAALLRVRPKLASFDIECYSCNHRKFPNMNYVQDIAYQISLVTQVMGRPGTRKKQLFQVGPIDPIEGATIKISKREDENIDRFVEGIQEENPSVIFGYNIIGFDIEYLTARLDLYGKKWGSMSLLKEGGTRLYTRNWESKAYGENKMHLFDIEGRSVIDIIEYVRKEFKLNSYSLQEVSMFFLGRGKHDVKPEEMFRVVEIKDPVERAREMKRIGDYCLEDACLPLDLFEQFHLWYNLTEMSSVFYLSLDDIYTRGQQIRAFNQIYAECFNQAIVIHDRSIEAKPYKGGKVAEPPPGIYPFINTLDFASLYPNIMIEHNICYTTLVAPESRLPNDMCHVTEIDDDNKDGETKGHNSRFVKKEYCEGVLPKILRNLLDERQKVKDEMKECKNPFEKAIKNAKQGALKVSANSIYGFTGVAKGRLPLPEAAETVTCIGRKKLTLARKATEDLGYTVLYGDTDSLMVESKGKNFKECQADGLELSKKVSAVTGLQMAYEESSEVFMPICPKKYLKLGFDGVLKNKGTLSARRDNCKWARTLYNRVVNAIMKRRSSLHEVLEIIHDATKELLSYSVPIKDLVITRQVRGNYKSESYPLKIFSDEMNRLGRPIASGERIAYLIVQVSGKDVKQGYKMRTLELYQDTIGQPDAERVDFEHYLEKVAANALDQVLYLAFRKEIDANLKWKPARKKPKKIYSFVSSSYTADWAKLVKAKRELINEIRDRRYLARCQAEYLSATFD